MLFEYCKEIEIPQNALAFTTELRNKLKEKAKRMRFLQYRVFSTEQIMTILNAD